MEALAGDADLEWLLIDSTVIRAHQHAAGKKGGQTDEQLGRSRGGFSTKVHVAVDALGNPVRLILSEGQVADITGAARLIEGLDFEALIADKGYDADWLRNLVERFTGWAKHFRRVATRYEKTARNFLSFWTFAAVINLLK